MKKIIYITLSCLLFSGIKPLIANKVEYSTPEQFFKIVDSLQYSANRVPVYDMLNSFIEELTSSSSYNKSVLAKANLRKGFYYRSLNQNAESLNQFNEALNNAILAGDSIEIANAYREMGYNYVITGKYEEGLDAYSNALQIDEHFENWTKVSIDLNAIGKIYEMWREFDKALEFFYKSLEISEQYNYLNQVAVRQASIASVYKSIGKFDLALERLEKSLTLEIELNNEVRKGYRLDQIGEIYTLMGEYKKAEDYLLRALKIFRENNVLVSESIVLNHIGLNYLKMDAFKNAEAYYSNSLEIAKRIGFNNMIQKNYEELSLLNEKRGSFNLALENYKNFIEIRDSAYNERARQQLLDFQVKYETEQKEKELAVLNQVRLEQELEINKSKQQRIIMIGVSIVLLILLGALLSRYYLKKRAQKQLQLINSQLNELNQTKDKFFNILAHDLKNPIYAFRNISSAVHDNYNELNVEEINYYTEELKNTSTKLSLFLDELLKWAASQTGRITPQPKPLNIAELLSEIIEMLAPIAKSKNIEINLVIDKNHFAFADRNMMHTVLRNILANAVKFTPEKGEINVESYFEDNKTYISISDNGIGISEDDIPKLFDVGSDPSKIGDSQEKGSGLGLILAKEFIAKNNGNIDVESKLNDGSTFIISLPVNPAN